MNLKRQKKLGIHKKQAVKQNSRNDADDSVYLEVSYKGKRKKENQESQKAQKTYLSKPGDKQIREGYEAFCSRRTVDVCEACQDRQKTV